MLGKEFMIPSAVFLNTIAICLLAGKITQMEKEKKDTLYELLYRIVYPIMGFAIGTMIAYFIKSV